VINTHTNAPIAARRKKKYSAYCSILTKNSNGLLPGAIKVNIEHQAKSAIKEFTGVPRLPFHPVSHLEINGTYLCWPAKSTTLEALSLIR